MTKWHVLYQNPQTVREGLEDIEIPLPARTVLPLAEARQRLFASLRREIKDARVIEAMEQVPRELFVPPEAFHLAYEDSPLPIGEGQTISQPLIVAMMTEALELKGDETVLEVGTGSGYQAAVLAYLARKVISVERKEGLFTAAQRRLAMLGIRNVELHVVAGKLGWPEDAPYHGIIVTAAAPNIPKSLTDQLDEGGRLVIPCGGRLHQELLKATRRGGAIHVQNLGGCAFVPLIGPEGWKEELQ